MDIRKIKKLIELVEESNINELEISEGEESVRISCGNVVATQVMQAAPAMMPAVAPAPVAAAPAEQAKAAISGHIVRSPMVGTFYASSSPDSAAFEIGRAHV